MKELYEKDEVVYFQLASIDTNEHERILKAFENSKYKLSDVLRKSLLRGEPLICMILCSVSNCFRWLHPNLDDKSIKRLSFNEFLNFVNPDEQITYIIQGLTIVQKVYTIRDLRKGRCAVTSDGTQDDIDKLLCVAFPKDPKGLYYRRSTTYYADSQNKGFWLSGNYENLPTQSVKLFLQQIQDKDSPTHLSSGQQDKDFLKDTKIGGDLCLDNPQSQNTNKKQTIIEQINNFDYSKVLEDSIPTTLPKQFYLNITNITDEEVKNKYITWLWKNNITDCDYEYVKDHVYFGLDYDDVTYSSFRNLWNGEFVEITIEDWLKFEGYKLEI